MKDNILPRIKKGDLVIIRSEEWHNRNTWLYVRLKYLSVSKFRGWSWRNGNEMRSRYWGMVTQVLSYDRRSHFARLACDNGVMTWHVCELQNLPKEKETKKEDS